MSGQVHFTVNQKKYSVAKEDQRTLIHFLRGELHQTGTKNGCENSFKSHFLYFMDSNCHTNYDTVNLWSVCEVSVLIRLQKILLLSRIDLIIDKKSRR